MRQPSTSEQKWAWWEAAIASDRVAREEANPQVGFYRVRRWRGKPYWLPARVWLEPGSVDPETGELLSDERLCAAIDGVRKNPLQVWLWLQPVTEEEYKWLMASRPLQPNRPPPPKSKQSP